MILTYDAIDGNGQHQADNIEATDAKEALEALRRRGLYVTEIAEQKAGSQTKTSSGTGKAQSGRLPVKTLAMLTRQMAMLLRAGSGVVPAMQAIRKQMAKPAHGAILDRVVHDLEEGATLTEALRRHPRAFDSTFCAIVQAGEASATLTEMFERLSSLVGKRKAMRNKILGSLAYPALLIVMSVKIIAVLVFFVLPRFAGMFDTLGADIPASTKLMMSVSNGAVEYWWACLGAMIAMVWGLVWMVRSPTGQQWISNIQTRVPLVGRLMVRLIQGQVFRTMGLLLESRVGVLDTLELTRGITTNDQFGRLFSDIEEKVTSGGLLSAAFEASPLVEPYVCQAIKTGEDSGNLGGAMSFAADILDESNTELVNSLTKLIEPVILIGMGLVVGGVAVSLFMPLFDMTSGMN